MRGFSCVSHMGTVYGHCMGTVRALYGHCMGTVWTLHKHCLPCVCVFVILWGFGKTRLGKTREDKGKTSEDEGGQGKRREHKGR